MLFILIACVVEPTDDSEVIPGSTSTTSDELLAYISNVGYFHRVGGKPSIISAYEVYSNLTNLHILDLRSNADFNNGHIEGAINVSSNTIITTIQNIGISPEERIVLVCETGQFSSYVQCLLGFYGIENTFTLRYGMASWNSEFSNVWQDNLAWYYNNFDYKMNDVHTTNPQPGTLPLIDELVGNTLEEKVKNRIEYLFETANTSNKNPVIESTLFTSFQNLYSHFNSTSESFHGLSVICYGIQNLYRFYGRTGHSTTYNHPPGTLWYNIPISLNSSARFFFQTLPNSEPLVIYSTNGHDSAFLMGFLRFLGYDAKSLLYGANAFGYNRMLNHEDPLIVGDAFTSADILDLPFVTSESQP